MPSEVAERLTVDPETQAYAPILYPTDFWTLKKYMVPLNESLYGTSLNLTLNFQNY